MRGTRWVRAALCVAVATCVAGEPLALARVRIAAVGPVMTIVTDPPSPDGSNGWFSTPPEIKMLSDVDATGWWSWNAGAPDGAPLTAGVPAFIGDAPEGLSDLAVSGVDASGTPGATVTASFMVDSIAPGTPGNFTAVAGPGVVDLAWDASVEAGSGLVGYTVYRNTVGAPFQLTDVVASTPATTWTDVAPPVADFVYYAVSARDTAGWESVFTAEAATTPDSAPPTDPGDLEAWLNASNWVKVSWLPSLDTGSGLSHYVVLRSLDGGPFEDIAHVGAGTAFYDDHDDQVLFASTVEYEVFAVDRVGLESGIAGPVPMQSDTVAPSPPSALAVTPVYSGTFTDAEFDLTWAGGADGGSGVASTELQWGPVAAAPNHAARVSDGSERVAADSETALLYFRMRSEDRAGNLSAFGMSVPARNIAAERVGGATRIQTAIAASAASFDSAATVVIASAASYPDALCSNSLAGTVDGPVLLVGSGPLPPGTLAEIARLGATDAYVVGGVAAVSPETEASLAGAVPGTVERVAGRDRYETAAEVARKVSDIGGGVPP
ncbi:MAG: cell wall-binding repeat-containing protein, partial [Actinobacteria bacterium]